MAVLTPTELENKEVRAKVSLAANSGEGLTSSLITDEVIGYDSNWGDACDYVYEEVIKHLVIAGQRPPISVTDFLNTRLEEVQVAQFRRAVVFRTAGNIVHDFRQTVGTTTGSPAGSDDELDFSEFNPVTKRRELFDHADDIIRRLRDAFPDDAFGRTRRTPRYFSLA